MNTTIDNTSATTTSDNGGTDVYTSSSSSKAAAASSFYSAGSVPSGSAAVGVSSAVSAIAGAAVGGVVGLVILCLLVKWLALRRRTKSNGASWPYLKPGKLENGVDLNESSDEVNPYTTNDTYAHHRASDAYIALSPHAPASSAPINPYYPPPLMAEREIGRDGQRPPFKGLPPPPMSSAPSYHSRSVLSPVPPNGAAEASSSMPPDVEARPNGQGPRQSFIDPAQSSSRRMFVSVREQDLGPIDVEFQQPKDVEVLPPDYRQATEHSQRRGTS
ncbi:hypothetical protein L202_01961 [Cryptococcus amylolentus CBS 6039]|uniref:Uncharacterized protein n=2 Tax=Cryptococcus amylolentus TaxID=104669 RepID=A0A1E3HYW4_9TREE|nr:hypothetical protein L202_01961 [Cryptococcus amylolentus CBS 6039]ODN81542.1 hypothetical protein L202_01961 [Cryptococcus amylolentus CBS 6039]ODO10228.1 hypothetical protein I350_02457 [Cryptococcus amylolentus CBS 6273]